MFALQWYYLIFWLPLGLAVLYLGVYVLSGWTFGDVDADHDVGHDVGHDADHDVGHHFEHQHNHDFRPLALLGVGKVPLSLVLMVLLMTFGFFGFASNRMLDDLIPGFWVIFASMPVALIGSMIATGLVSNAMARWLPMDQSFAVRARELVGRRATLLYDLPPNASSTAIVKDQFGNRHQISVVSNVPVQKQIEVVLVQFDAAARQYRVVPFESLPEEQSIEIRNSSAE